MANADFINQCYANLSDPPDAEADGHQTAVLGLGVSHEALAKARARPKHTVAKRPASCSLDGGAKMKKPGATTEVLIKAR